MVIKRRKGKRIKTMKSQAWGLPGEHMATYLKYITRWPELSSEVKEIISHHDFPGGVAGHLPVGVDLDGYGH